MRRYIGAFIAGVKENLEYREGIVGDLLYYLISIVVLYAIWRLLTSSDFLPYFIVVNLLLPTGDIYNTISSNYQTAIRKGWDVQFAKPVDAFLFRLSYDLGEMALPYLSGAAVGILALHMLGIWVSIPVLIVSVPFALMLEASLAYLISGFTFFTHTTWGIRVVVWFSDLLTGGRMFPLYLAAPAMLGILSLTPFVHKGFFLVEAVLHGYLPVESYVALAAWSLVIGSAGFVLHNKGWKVFEAQGG
ncbi:MAG: hypothetical protein QW035_02975 [Candidatus Anstonellales archaeon]